MAESTCGRSDWPPQWARWAHLARSGFPALVPQVRKKKFSFLPYSNKSSIDQYFWTSSRSIKTQKKNLANIQLSWPHIWSITHIYHFFSFSKSTILVLVIYVQALYCLFWGWPYWGCVDVVSNCIMGFTVLVTVSRGCVGNWSTYDLQMGQSHGAVRQNTNSGSRITSGWLSDCLNWKACSQA